MLFVFAIIANSKHFILTHSQYMSVAIPNGRQTCSANSDECYTFAKRHYFGPQIDRMDWLILYFHGNVLFFPQDVEKQSHNLCWE